MDKNSLIYDFLNELNSKSIDYVHWKSNTAIERALIAKDDLDLLIKKEDKTLFLSALRKFDFHRALSVKDKWQDDIFHYIGSDSSNNVMVHVHAHFDIPLGYDFDKKYVLPVSNQLLKNPIFYKAIIKISNPEIEYLVLVIRILIKNSFLPFLFNLPGLFYRRNLFIKHSKFSKNAHKEFLDLRGKINREKLKEQFNLIPFLEYEQFLNYENTIYRDPTLIKLLKVSSGLKSKLSKYQNHNDLISFLKIFLRILRHKYGYYFDVTKSKKTPLNGGKIIAFIGGDGAGKTSNIEFLKKIYSKIYKTKTIHIGRPSFSLFATLVFKLTILFKKINLKKLSNVTYFIILAKQRKRAYKSALKLKQKGYIVILDRLPFNGIEAMDSPKIEKYYPKKLKLLSLYENLLYRRIGESLDKLIVLKLDPEIALIRRPDDDPDELRIRSGEVFYNKWDYYFADVIDTNHNTIQEVQVILQKTVWNTINSDYFIAELAGINGAGKSTLSKYTLSQYANLNTKLSYNLVDLIFLVFNLLKNASKKNNFNKDLSKINYYYNRDKKKLYSLKNKKLSSNLLLDQTFIYYLAILKIENRINEKEIQDSIILLNEIGYKSIFISCSFETAYERINSRHLRVGRGVTLNPDEFHKFCNSFQKEYMNIQSKLENSLVLDSEKKSIPENFSILNNFLLNIENE